MYPPRIALLCAVLIVSASDSIAASALRRDKDPAVLQGILLK